MTTERLGTISRSPQIPYQLDAEFPQRPDDDSVFDAAPMSTGPTAGLQPLKKNVEMTPKQTLSVTEPHTAPSEFDLTGPTAGLQPLKTKVEVATESVFGIGAPKLGDAGAPNFSGVVQAQRKPLMPVEPVRTESPRPGMAPGDDSVLDAANEANTAPSEHTTTSMSDPL